ncbi:MAG: hypothetical protein DRQ61_06020 [Gammaproteobacteria bacterium]|nr:MAG: hypothetical protein DRQ56_04365 [Gammaproteobacteria bacterium]RLA22575.1 MAG: hypothetical protein DRQ61_06020 [Gammaproteobacteria bacterium]
MLAYEPLAEIETLFLSIYPRTDQHDELALFVRHESEGRLHCEVKVYFPPAAGRLAHAANATPCRTPSFNGLSLLVGSEMALPHLFPNHR